MKINPAVNNLNSKLNFQAKLDLNTTRCILNTRQQRRLENIVSSLGTPKDGVTVSISKLAGSGAKGSQYETWVGCYTKNGIVADDVRYSSPAVSLEKALESVENRIYEYFNKAHI